MNKEQENFDSDLIYKDEVTAKPTTRNFESFVFHPNLNTNEENVFQSVDRNRY